MKKIVAILFFSFTAIFTCLSASASSSFSLHAFIPSNQINKSLTYFDLLVKPSQTQTVTVELNNPYSRELTFDVEVGSAKTNNNLVVEYATEALPADVSLKTQFKDIVKYPTKVTVPKQTTKKIDFTFTTPKNSFKGILAGGIKFTEKIDDSKKQSGQFGIINRYSYVLGMVLHEDLKTSVKPTLYLDSVTPSFKDNQLLLLGNMRNTESAYINDIHAKVDIYKHGDRSKIIFSQDTKNQQVAPNSKFAYALTLSKKDLLTPGEYDWVMTVTGREGKWTFDKTFTIQPDTANQLNQKQKALQPKESNFWKIVIGIIVFLLIALFFFLFFLWKRYKKVKEELEEAQVDKKTDL